MKRAKERDSSETAAIKINRRKVCLLIIAIGISVLLLITMLHLEKSNTRRYREENHARFDVNTQAFQEVLDSSDAWIDNLKTSIYALPYLETASAADFLADLKQPGVKLAFDESPFPTDKNGNKLLGRLQGLIMASSSFSEGAIYNPQTGHCLYFGWTCVSAVHRGGGALRPARHLVAQHRGRRADRRARRRTRQRCALPDAGARRRACAALWRHA